MTRDLARLVGPRSIAVIGGGEWCRQVILQCERIGYGGAIWPVHPKSGHISGHQVYRRLEDLPEAPDASFIGINRSATIEAVADLSAMGAGGAVCFASGFSEAQAEDETGADLQARLIGAAGDMPILGPNCYGLINALDGALLWPDQHGLGRVDRGVAILTQSSNIAINLTMQRRGLPIAYMVTCGNMAQTSQAEIASGLLDDDRVTAIGLHIEGFSDLREWEALAAKARARNVPMVAIKVGRSEQAQAATVSHTASIAGQDAGAQALLDRLGIARVDSLPSFLETLKLLHVTGPLESNNIASVSCSGGEASLAADSALSHDLNFPALNPRQSGDLRAALGPKVALANPLDYHTYIWRDTAAMTRAFSAICDAGVALTVLIVDYPHTDATDWQCATDAALATRAETQRPVAVVSTLPELMPADVAKRLIEGGVVPMQGLAEAMAAAQAAVMRAPAPAPLLLPGEARRGDTLSEAASKAVLSGHGMNTPKGFAGDLAAITSAAGDLCAPLALKGQGIAHKTEAMAVALGLAHTEITAAAEAMPTDRFLIEEMARGGVAELLIGVVRDPAHGFILTIAAGGVMTEILGDSVSVLVPETRGNILRALQRLRCFPTLTGFRGKPAADIDAVLDAIEALQAYTIANSHRLEEVEINPLICTPETAIAVDALIRKAPE